MDYYQLMQTYMANSNAPIDKSPEGLQIVMVYMDKVNVSLKRVLGCMQNLGNYHAQAMKNRKLFKDKKWLLEVSLLTGAMKDGSKKDIMELLDCPPGCKDVYFYTAKALSEMSEMAECYEAALGGNHNGFALADSHRQNISEYAVKVTEAIDKVSILYTS